jgi:ketosteroid isomerase-like protein
MARVEVVGQQLNVEEGFRRTDHQAILALLADDVTWVLRGYRTLRGKEAFDSEIENDAFTGDRISRLETFHINLDGDGDTLFTA